MRNVIVGFIVCLFLSVPDVVAQAPGDSIGFSYYDYLTSGSATRNLVRYDDGALSFARIAATDSLQETLGTHYKFFNGASWSTEWARIESTQTGFSSIDQFPAAGGVAAVVTSTTVSVDAARGANVWTTLPFPCGTGGSPRMAIGGFSFFVHVIAPTPNSGVIAYHSSSDAGNNWLCTEYTLAHQGAVVEPDGYDITTQDENVAFVVAGAGGDVVVVESTNNGETWTETVVHDIDESLMTPGEEPPDGSCSIIYDEEGILNVAWGSYLSDGNGSYVESIEAGIRYWSEPTGVLEVAWPVNDTTIVNPGGRDGNLASQPDITVLDGNTIAIIYSSFISERDTRGNNYEHVFGLWLCNGTLPRSLGDLTQGSGFDAAFPSVAEWGDYEIIFTYAADRFAGNSVSGVHEPIPVAYMYRSVDARCFHCCYPPPYPPSLISPPDGAVGVPVSGPLQWDGQWPYADYRVQVSENQGFSTVVFDSSGISATTLELDGLSNGTTYFWRVNAENGWGLSDWSEVWSFTTLVTGVEDEEPEIPSAFMLYQNHPNPFNPTTTFRYSLPKSVDVDLRVLNLLGEKIATLISGHRDAGTHTVQWDASSQPSGVYFYRLRAGEFVETRKLVLMK